MTKGPIGDGLCLKLVDSETCKDITKCPIDGVWGGWSKTQDCDKLCGKGIEIYSRECDGPYHGGKECVGDSEETRECFRKRCICEVSSWSEWTVCKSINGFGCGQGKRTRDRNITNEDLECYWKPGNQLMQEKPCFIKHCTDEFFRLHSIEINVLESMYPGKSHDWELIITDNSSFKFNCTTSGISYLMKGNRRISGIDLGECTSDFKIVSPQDFLEMGSLELQLRPKEIHDHVVLERMGIEVCDDDRARSSTSWQFDIRGYNCFGYAKTGLNGEFDLRGEKGCRFDHWPSEFIFSYSTPDQINKYNVRHIHHSIE